MKKVRKGTKRTLALILSALLLVGSLPGKVYAEEAIDPLGEQEQIILEEDTEASGEEASVLDASTQESSEVEAEPEIKDPEEDDPEEIENSEDEQNPEEVPEAIEDQASMEESGAEDILETGDLSENKEMLEEQKDDSLFRDKPTQLWDLGRRHANRKTGNTNKTITGLGTGAIRDPKYPGSKDDPWEGSYVWYGFEWQDKEGNQEPVRYRVLDAKTDRFGSDTMFLDCDTILAVASGYYCAENEENVSYATFSLREALNAKEYSEFDFLQEEEFEAVAASTVASHKISDQLSNLEIDGKKAFTDYTPLESDRVFFLDYEDIVNRDYGYASEIGYNQAKYFSRDTFESIGYLEYLLRSFVNSDYLEADSSGYKAAFGTIVHGTGNKVFAPKIVLSNAYYSGERFISPAFNLKRKNIVFSSLVSGTAGEAGAEYKLTLLNYKEFDLSASDVKEDGNKYTVPFWIGIGEAADGNKIGPTQVSVVVTDGTWSEDGWSDGAKLLQYSAINNDSFTKLGNGEGTFSLDSSITGEWGKDYHVYLVAECINGEKESDLSSAPYEIFPHAHTIKVTAKGDVLTATCSKPGCNLPDNKISVRIEAPEADTYGSKDSYAAFIDGEDVSKFMAIVSAHYKDDLTIYYNGRGDTNYAISKVPPKGVGSYTASLTIGGETAAVNYEIQKKDLTVTADDKKIFYGENAPSNYTYSCDGFVNGDNKSSLGGDISFECKYRNGDDAGEYAIVPKGLTSDNYDISFKPGKLIVQKSSDILATGPREFTNLPFTGMAQALIDPGTSDHGQYWYAVTDLGSSEPEFDNGKYGIWSTSAPTAVDAGYYKVWYQFKGDKNHNDIKASYITASIAKKLLPEEDSVKTIQRKISIESSGMGQTIEISKYLPEDCGKITNVRCSYNNNDFYFPGDKPHVSNDNTEVSFGIGFNLEEAVADTITLAVTTQNYDNNFTINCVLTVVSYGLSEKKGNLYSQVTTQNILVGKSVTLYMTDKNGLPVKGEKLLWNSDDPGIVSVTQTGKITGVSAGRAYVTVQRESSDEPEAQCEIVVSDPVTEITLDMKKYSFGIGEEAYLTASILPWTAPAGIRWSTSDKDAVIICDRVYGEQLFYSEDVNGKGRVYDATSKTEVIVCAVGPAKGKVTVTAEAADGSGKKASCTFEVGNPVGDFTITPKSGKNVASSLQAGKTVNMAVNWTDGAPKNKELTWSVVDNEGYDIYRTATVSEKGVLKGISEGTIRVKAESKANHEKYAISDPIVIYVPVKSVALREKAGTVSLDKNSEDALINVDLVAGDGSKGGSQGLVYGEDNLGSNATGDGSKGRSQSITEKVEIIGCNATGETLGDRPYVSFDIPEKYKSLIDVDDLGYVSAKKSIPAGTKLPATAYVDVTIHAYNYQKTLSYKVTVKEKNPLKGITLQKNLTVGVNNEVNLSALLNPVNPDSTFNPNLKWTISDKEIISISPHNECSLLIVGLKPGTATITVSTRDSFKTGKKEAPFTASCKVTVKPSVSGVRFKNAETLTKNGLAVGKTFKLQPEFTLTGKGSAASKTLVWESSDPADVVVSDKGVVTAVNKKYNVTITATMAETGSSFVDGAPSVSVTFNVFDQVKTIKADKSKMTIGTQGNSRFGRISIAAFTPDKATDPSVKWNVDKNNTGVLLGVINGDKTVRNAVYTANPGESVITRKYESLAVMGITPGVVKITGVTIDGSNKKVSCTVTVKGQVTKLKLKEKSDKNGYNGILQLSSTSPDRRRYETTMKPNTSMTVPTDLEINGITSSDKRFNSYKKYTDTGLVFRSSNPKVATVDSKGKIKILKNPEDIAVTIYITTIDGRQTAELNIYVNDGKGGK